MESHQMTQHQNIIYTLCNVYREGWKVNEYNKALDPVIEYGTFALKSGPGFMFYIFRLTQGFLIQHVPSLWMCLQFKV